MIKHALRVVQEATKAVPAVRYALGVAGVMAAFALGASFFQDARIAFLSTLGMLALMLLLFVFAKAAVQGPSLIQGPAILLVWTITLLFITAASLTTSGVFFNYPKSFRELADELFPESEGVSREAESGSESESVQPTIGTIDAASVYNLTQLVLIEAEGDVESVALDPLDRWFAATIGGVIKLYDVATGEVLRSLYKGEHATLALEFSHDGTYLAAGSDDGFIRIWETNRFTLERQIPSVNRNGRIRAMKFAHDMNDLFFADKNLLRVVRAPTWAATRSTVLERPEWESIETLEIGAERHVALGLLSGDVLILDFDLNEVVKWRPDPANHSGVTTLAYDPKGSLLVAGTGNHQNGPVGAYGFAYAGGTEWAVSARGWVFDVIFLTDGIWAWPEVSGPTLHRITQLRSGVTGEVIGRVQHPDLHISGFVLNRSATRLAIFGAEDLVANIPPAAGAVTRPQRHVIRIYGVPE